MLNYNVTEIANGVGVCVIPTDRFKTNIISVKFSLPLDGDIEANALLCFMLRHGTKKYPSITDINKRLSEMYGASLQYNVYKVGETHVISFQMTSVNDKFSIDDKSISKECLEFLLDMIFEPKTENGHFAEDDINREKRLLTEKIESEFSEKRIYSLDRLIEEMCVNENYSKRRFGDKETINTVDTGRLEKAYENMLKKSSVHINIVGNVYGGAVDMIKERFEKIDRSSLAPLHTEFIVSADKIKHVEEKLAVKQGKLVMGLRAGMTDKDDNYFAVRVMTDMLGGGPYSKLFMNVREKMSLCYYCSARLHRNKGIIIIQSGIEDENREKAENAILAEIKNMQGGNFTEEDLQKSIKGLTDAALGVYDTPEGIDSWFLPEEFPDKFLTVEEFCEKISAVTMEEVRVAAMGVSVDTVYMLSSEKEDNE